MDESQSNVSAFIKQLQQAPEEQQITTVNKAILASYSTVLG